MKVLVIDRDRDACEQLQTTLEAAKIEVTFEPTKNNAIELAKKGAFDVIIIDPAPANEMRSFIMGVRRSTNSFPPILVTSHTFAAADVAKAGGNEFIKKPIDKDELLKKIQNAARITEASRLMADESEDFPSKEGLIAKSAFNQLFITCLDRADRHGEKSFLIFVSVDNLSQIAVQDGQEQADKVANNLRRTISRTRRTSDIAGHIKKAEFCLLLLRPGREDEPFLAANRFAESLKENIDLIATSPTKAILKVWLLAIPSGEIPVEHVVQAP
ncbi:MAG: response regulator [Alphaproteobacteria bacterium]|nr:response regulator [Alphaproteobacteria bacterium]